MKLLLIIESGSLTGQQFELEQGSLSLGRSAESHIKFDFQKDPGVSSHHAVIHSENNTFRLIDEHSTNGTLVNGSLTQDSFLQDGDTIRLGVQGPQLRVSIQQPAERTQEFRIPVSDENMQPPPLPPQSSASATTLPGGISRFSPQQMMQTREGKRTLIGCVVSGLICGFLMLLVMALMISQLGFFAAFVGTIVAFLPLPFYLFAVFWIDRFDPEPGWAISASFAWGGLVAILSFLRYEYDVRNNDGRNSRSTTR